MDIDGLHSRIVYLVRNSITRERESVLLEETRKAPSHSSIIYAIWT